MNRLVGLSAAFLAVLTSCGLGRTCETPADCNRAAETCDFVNSVCVTISRRDAGSHTDGGSAGGGFGDAGTSDAGIDVDIDAGFLQARLSSAQALYPGTEMSSGLATFGLIKHPNGDYTLSGSVTHSAAATSVRFRLGWPGLRYENDFCPLSVLSGAWATCELNAFQVEGFFLTFSVNVEIVTSNGEIRGQLIPLGAGYWAAPFDVGFGGSGAGAQLVVLPDGGIICAGESADGFLQATAAHVHQGGVGGTGSAFATLTVRNGREFSGRFSIADLTAADTDGGLYVDVHAQDGGVLRGQLIKQY